MVRQVIAMVLAVLCAFVPMGGARFTFCIADACAAQSARLGHPRACCSKASCCRKPAPHAPAGQRMSSTHSCDCCVTIELGQSAGDRIACASTSAMPSPAAAMPIEDSFATAFAASQSQRSLVRPGARAHRPPPQFALRI